VSSQVKERPILFSGAMVRALLDGSKTQTRRALKVRCQEIGERADGSRWPWSEHPDTAADHWHACPYGQPGDRLWVRETFQGPLFDGDRESEYRADPEVFNSPEFCQYAADGGAAPEFMTMDDEWVCRWRPSIHMPRWASRILLEVVSVRVERLQDISEVDAIAEGMAHVRSQAWDREHFPAWRCLFEEAVTAGTKPPIGPSPAQAYEKLWDSINGAGSWDANPWVWVVEFKRVAS